MDESSLTGEALPAEKTSALLLFSGGGGSAGPAATLSPARAAGAVGEAGGDGGEQQQQQQERQQRQQEIPIAERTNMVFMGTLVCNGHGKALVVGTGMQSEFGKTFAEMRDMETRRTPLQAKMDTLAKQVRRRNYHMQGRWISDRSVGRWMAWSSDTCETTDGAYKQTNKHTHTNIPTPPPRPPPGL